MIYDTLKHLDWRHHRQNTHGQHCVSGCRRRTARMHRHPAWRGWQGDHQKCTCIKQVWRCCGSMIHCMYKMCVSDNPGRQHRDVWPLKNPCGSEKNGPHGGVTSVRRPQWHLWGGLRRRIWRYSSSFWSLSSSLLGEKWDYGQARSEGMKENDT